MSPGDRVDGSVNRAPINGQDAALGQEKSVRTTIKESDDLHDSVRLSAPEVRISTHVRLT